MDTAALSCCCEKSQFAVGEGSGLSSPGRGGGALQAGARSSGARARGRSARVRCSALVTPDVWGKAKGGAAGGGETGPEGRVWWASVVPGGSLWTDPQLVYPVDPVGPLTTQEAPERVCRQWAAAEGALLSGSAGPLWMGRWRHLSAVQTPLFSASV